MTEVFLVKPPRRAPVKTEGAWPWMRSNLFSDISKTVLSVVLIGLLLWAVAGIARWGIVHAVFAADPDLCQAARGIGACWGVVNEKARLIVLGRYPQSEH